MDADEEANRIDGALTPLTLAEGMSLKSIAPAINVESATKNEMPMKRCVLDTADMQV